MATTSFKKEFVVKDKKTSDKLRAEIASQKSTVRYSKKNVSADKEKGESLLARLVSA